MCDWLFAEATTSEDLKELSDAKNLIAHLYSSMNVEQHQIEQEKELLKKLEHLKMELAPMEEVYAADCSMIFRVKGDDFIKKNYIWCYWLKKQTQFPACT